MLGSLGLMLGGAAIVGLGIYFWANPERYYRHLHKASLLADLNVRPPIWAVKLGAGLSVIIGLAVAGWGAIPLLGA
jgi:hypothetical protein